MKRTRVHAELLRTIGLAAVGFLALLLALPEWARGTVALFALLYGILVVVIDDDVRALFFRTGRAKSPASRRAAT